METPFEDCVSTLIPSSPFSQALMAALQVTVSQTPAGSKGARTKMAPFRTPFRVSWTKK